MCSEGYGPVIGGVETGGTKIVCALGTAPDRIVARTEVPTTERPDLDLDRVASFFADAGAGERLSGLGIASFGPCGVNRDSPTWGRVTTTPKPGWSGARFQDALAEFAVPMRVDTDVNGAALGEYLAGAGQGCSTLAYTTVGTGIGTGVVKHGQPVTGFSHYESGHIRPRRDAALDPFEGCCPYHGDCLEGLACGE